MSTCAQAREHAAPHPDPACAEVPVVVLTAKDLTRDDRRRLQGANEVLSKGMTSLADLLRGLAKVLAPAKEMGA